MFTRFSLVALLALAPVTALAQTTGSVSTDSEAVDQVRENARIHVGPLYVTPKLLLKQFGVDNNVFYSTADQKSDFTFTVAPTINAWVPVAHRALFSATVAPDLVYFAKYGTERSIDPELFFRGEVYLNHLTLYAEDSFLSSRQRPNFEIDLRSRRSDNLAGGGLIWNFTRKTAVDVSLRHRTLSYDADAFFEGNSLRESLNHESTGIAVTPRYKLTPLTTLSMRIEALQERFPFSPERENDTFRVMPGVQFKANALISGSAFVGYRRLSPLDTAALAGYNGPVASLGLSYTMHGATTFGVSYDRDLQYSVDALQPYFVSSAFGLSLRRALGMRFDVIGTMQRYLYDYRELTTSSLAFTAPRVDHVQTYSGTLGYRLGRVGRLGFGAWYTNRDSSRVERAFNGLRFGTTMTYGF